MPWAIILAASIFGIRWTLLGSDNPHYRFYVTVVPLIVWLLAFAAVIKADIGRWTTCATVLGFALVAFVLQDLVNFASTIPATLTTAFAVLGVTIATLGAPARRELRRSTIRPFVVMPVAGIIAMVYFIGLYWPVGQMNAWLQSARTAATPNVSLDRYEHAVVSDKLDPTPCFEFARWLRADWNSLPNRGFALDRATVSIELAIARDPLNVALYREKALCFRLRGHEMKSERDLSVAVDAAREAVALYPTDPDGYILLADCLVMLDQARNDVATLNFAVQSYEKAIAQDNSRPEWEEIQRLTPAQRQTIQTRISETQAKVHSRHH